jgi:hypothetical protein
MNDDLKQHIRKILVAHGTADLYPDDEFDCCVNELAESFEIGGTIWMAGHQENLYRIKR